MDIDPEIGIDRIDIRPFAEFIAKTVDDGIFRLKGYKAGMGERGIADNAVDGKFSRMIEIFFPGNILYLSYSMVSPVALNRAIGTMILRAVRQV